MSDEGIGISGTTRPAVLPEAKLQSGKTERLGKRSGSDPRQSKQRRLSEGQRRAVAILKVTAVAMVDTAIAAAIVFGNYHFTYNSPHQLTALGMTTAVVTKSTSPDATSSVTTIGGSGGINGIGDKTVSLLGAPMDLSATASSGTTSSTDATGTTSSTDVTGTTSSTDVSSPSGTAISTGASSSPTAIGDWSGAATASLFSDTVQSTDSTYKSKDISVTLSRVTYTRGAASGSAGTAGVGSGTATYTIADIYVKDIRCLQTMFGDNTYGIGYKERVADMSATMKSIIAVNGDSYSNNQNRNNGTLIRNGIVYRMQKASDDICVLYRDGTMKTFSPDNFDAAAAVSDGAWQTWVFGPSLLDDNGKAKTTFLTTDYIKEKHPRTAIGYYAPGHYCLIVVDGRKVSSDGLDINELSQVFESLGCKAAYNLDGGSSVTMTWGTTIVSSVKAKGANVSDGIFICEPGA